MTDKKTSSTTDAQKDFDDKTAAVTAAELAVEQAQQAKVEADAKTIDASDAALDKCLLAQAVAAGRINVLALRLVACRERLAVSAAALQEANLADLKAASSNADAALAQVDADIQISVPAAVAVLASIWQVAQLAVDNANAARAAVAKALGVPVTLAGGRAVEALVSIPGTRTPDPVASTASLVAWLAAAPARAAERRLFEERRAGEQAARDLSGLNGPSAREAARLAARDFNISIGMVPADHHTTDHVRPRQEFDGFDQGVA